MHTVVSEVNGNYGIVMADCHDRSISNLKCNIIATSKATCNISNIIKLLALTVHIFHSVITIRRVGVLTLDIMYLYSGWERGGGGYGSRFTTKKKPFHNSCV
jgi:hypothetical protein